MNSSAREKIFKTWSSISEVTLIKEVATKGEHIQLCIEFWARKRKVSPADYAGFFHDVVYNESQSLFVVPDGIWLTYVQRLLAERLVCKAETVLRNVQRDYRCVYYQFASESGDSELRELLYDHLRQRDPLHFEEKIAQLQFYWELMQQLQSSADLYEKYKKQMRRISLETLMALDEAAQQRLMVALYFANVANASKTLLPHLEARYVWQHLVETQQTPLLVRWCCLQAALQPKSGGGGDSQPPQCGTTDLERHFFQWPLEPEMYEHALRTLQQPSEALRNCFARAGHFFGDERQSVVGVVATVLRRICTTESFVENRELLERLPIGAFLLQHGYFALMLRPFVAARELEELAEANEHEHGDILKLIVALKEHDLTEREGFEKIAQSVKTYLESPAAGVNFDSDQPLVTFYEFLCNEPTMAALNCFLLSSALKHVPYLRTLARRLESNGGNNGSTNDNNNGANLHSPYDFLRKFKHIDFKEICKETLDEVASFSNKRLCERYARKYQLNFLHHLKQHRGAYAAYYLLTEQLQNYAQVTRAQLFAACESVTELALQNSANAELRTHCVAFIEMLGFDTQLLRSFLKLSHLLAEAGETTPAPAAVDTYADLIAHVERVLAQRLAKAQAEGTDDSIAHFPLADYQALMRMVVCNQQRQWPHLIMRQYAAANDWWRLLVLLQYFEVPLSQVRALAAHFGNRAMGEHLLRALSYEPLVQPSSATAPATERNAKRQTSFSRRHQQQQQKQATENYPTTTSAETMTSSISSCNDAAAALLKSTTSAIANASHTHHQQQQQLLHSTFLPDATGSLDLFAIILLSTNVMAPTQPITCTTKFLELMQDDHRTHATACNLMKNCVKFRLPVLALLAATVSAENVDWNWLVWLAVATDQWEQLLLWTHVTGDIQLELTWRLIESSVRLGATATLYRSFCIFYEDNPLLHLLRFLHRTQNSRDFSDEVIHELRLYLLAWSNHEIKLPLGTTPLRREQLMLRTLKLLLVQLQHNFNSSVEQQNFLGCICRSDMSDISGQLDFCLLVEVFAILQTANTPPRPINFEALLQRDAKEYEQHLQALLEAQQYDAAVRLATLLHLPISDIVYAKWVAGVDEAAEEVITLQRYEDEIVEHSLPPELLVNFFLYAASRILEPCARKYLLLKRALNVIKRNHLFPNESFDRDQIEYEMIACYLQMPDAGEVTQLEIYHSEYYEEIMLKERCVLYKSFLELKELAGIEDLSVSLKTPLTADMQNRLEALIYRLLDEGDIVEALRLQNLFDWRPMDLRFIVFCMALAEGVTTIDKLSMEERQLLREIEKGAFAKFNKRTLNTLRGSGSGSQQYSSPLKTTNTQSDLSDSCSTLEFEEIPSKEKREVLDIIQGVASKLKYGVSIGKRIVMAYRAAMYLDKEYMDVLRTKDTSVLVQSVAEEGCLRRLLVVSDIFTSTHMTDQEIAELLAFEITTAVVRPRFYIFSSDHNAKNTFKSANLWGYNIDRDLHLFLELTPNTTKLGHSLLEYCDALKTYRKYQDDKPYEHNVVFEKLAEIILRYGLPPTEATTATTTPTLPPQVLSHKKQNLIYVEMLIKAHQCFVHECSMEGIANVLNRAKALSIALTAAKSWSLLVRMLVGLGRYREMFYCFDALIENEQFESLLGQFDEDRGLRQAILAYLREYSPANGRELLRLAALHFLMYKELAELWEQDAQAVLERVRAMALVCFTSPGGGDNSKPLIPKLQSTPEVLRLLQQALEYYTHATENYLLDNKMLLAQKSAARAEMIALQIDLANKALDKTLIGTAAIAQHMCVCVLNVQTRDEFREIINSELRVPQTMILGRAYAYDINWAEVLLTQYILLQRKVFLHDYLTHLSISDSIIDNVIKSFLLHAHRHKTTPQMEENLAQLVELIKSVTLKYKLASMLSLKSTVMSLINEQTMYYLKDTNYGRSERNNMSEMEM